MPVGEFSDDVLVSPDGTRTYVLESDGVSVIDTATAAVVTTLTLPGGPSGIGMTPDGSRVHFATNSGFVSVLDPVAGAVTATISVGGRLGPLAVGGDGRLVYVTMPDADAVAVVDTVAASVIATVPVEATPMHIAATPDGSRVYSWGQENQAFSVIDTATDTVVGQLPLDQVDGITMSPDGARTYVLSGLGTITVLDPAAMTVVGRIRSPLGARPVSLAVSPDNAHLYVAISDIGDGEHALRVLDTSSTYVVEELRLSADPTRISLSGDGATLVASSERSALVIDTSGYAGGGSVPVTAPDPAGPVTPTVVSLGEEASLEADIGFSPSGDRVYVSSEQGVVVLETATSAPIGTIATEQGIGDLVVDPTGTRAAFPTVDGIEVLDLTTNLVVDVFPSEIVYDLLGFTADGSSLIASIGGSDGGGANLSRVDLTTGRITTLAPAVNDPSLALTGDGTTAYVGGQIAASGSAVTAVDTTTGATTPVAGTDGISTLAMGLDGRTLYGIGALSRVVVDTADNSIVTEGQGAPNAGLLAASPTGAHLFAPDRIDGTLSVVTADDGEVVETLPTGEYPGAIALAPDGRRLYVASRGGLSVLDVTAFP
ncbi:MAG: hypothetical protein H0V89_14800 [Deltaproteobacteria bacterium]|nr:hypothetical protein [Deltaproteobacteria bacterium]